MPTYHRDWKQVSRLNAWEEVERPVIFPLARGSPSPGRAPGHYARETIALGAILPRAVGLTPSSTMPKHLPAIGSTTTMADLPTGTGTLLFTDIEGSTRLLQQQGERYGSLVLPIRLIRTRGALRMCQPWQRERRTFGWPDLGADPKRALPLQSLVDADAPEFLNPDDKPAAIRASCRPTSQSQP